MPSFTASTTGIPAASACQFTVMICPKITEARTGSRNTNPRLTGTGCIDATATVAAVGAGTPGELIIGVIAKELVGTASTIDLIRAPAPAHEILAILSECLVTVRATKDGVVARAPTDDIIAAKA